MVEPAGNYLIWYGMVSQSLLQTYRKLLEIGGPPLGHPSIRALLFGVHMKGPGFWAAAIEGFYLTSQTGLRSPGYGRTETACQHWTATIRVEVLRLTWVVIKIMVPFWVLI